jgi:hypothetical protein
MFTANHHSQNFFTSSNNTNNNLPINHRAPWTDKETKQLIKEIKNNLTIEEISNIHKRTINAIKYKLIRYAIDLADTDQSLSLNDISKKTGLSINELKEGFDKLHYNYEYMEDNDSINDTDEDDDSDSDFTDDTFIDNKNQTNVDDSDIKDIRNDIININRKIKYISIGFVGYCLFNIAFTIYSKFNLKLVITNTDTNDLSLMLLSKK